MSERVVRVACGQGFWGDRPEAPLEQVTRGPVDYVVMDYLAEVTMSILQKAKRRDPNGVRSLARSIPPFGAAVFEVFRAARARDVPWQSAQSISTAARASPYRWPLPWLSCSKWQSTQCMPLSR